MVPEWVISHVAKVVSDMCLYVELREWGREGTSMLVMIVLQCVLIQKQYFSTLNTVVIRRYDLTITIK